MHNLPFVAADHLSSLFSSVPDSAIAADFACKRTKTTAIVCEALDPYYKKTILENFMIPLLACFVTNQMKRVTQ